MLDHRGFFASPKSSQRLGRPVHGAVSLGLRSGPRGQFTELPTTPGLMDKTGRRRPHPILSISQAHAMTFVKCPLDALTSFSPVVAGELTLQPDQEGVEAVRRVPGYRRV